MKVRINYSTEVDEITKKLSDLTKATVMPLQVSAELLNSTSVILKHDGNNAVSYSHQTIDRVRKNLAEIDEMLADTQGLMSGYINNILNPQSQSPQAPQPEVPDKPPKGWDPIKKVYYDREVSNPPEGTEIE